MSDRTLDLVDVHVSVHPPGGVRLRLDASRPSVVVLIGEFADQFLSQVLDSEHAGEAAVFVDDAPEFVAGSGQGRQRVWKRH